MRAATESGWSKKQKRLGVFALVALIVTLIVITLPARVVYGIVAKQVPEMQMRGLKGSFWHGSADQVYFKQTLVGKLSWRISAVNLLTLSPKADIQLENTDERDAVNLNAAIAYQGGEWHLSRVTAKANAAWLKPALGLPAIDPGGYLAANFSQLKLNAQGLPISANGNVQWLQAAITGAAQAELGSFDITLKDGSDQRILGTVQPIGASPVSVNGQFELKQQNFQAEMRIFSVNNDPNVNRALAFIGQSYNGPDAKANERLLKIQGQIELGKP